MTLHTKILIEQPMPPRPVFDFVNDLIGGQPEHLDDKPRPGEAEKYHNTYFPDGSHIPWCGGEREFGNHLGVGLSALLWVKFGSDGPLPTFCEQEPECCDKADAEHDCDPKGAIEINLDTAYGYRSESNAGCADLHAWIIREVGRWLDDQGASWLWYDEFRGSYHRGFDDCHLGVFGNADLGALKVATS